MAYSAKVLDHYENPRNVGTWEPGDDIGTGMVGAPACFSGDTLISISDNNITLKEAFDNGEDISVWSYNVSTSEFEVKTARAVSTGKKVLHKTLINGYEVWVTEDHKFLMVDGSYKLMSNIYDIDSITTFHSDPRATEFNHRLVHTTETKDEDTYTLQVEENNNYVVITDKTERGCSGVVVKNCGDVMKLQIRVEDNIITDAVFKTYGCFVSNTNVNTPTKQKKISDLVIGDEVLAWNGNNIVSNKIKEIIVREVEQSELVVVTFQREQYRKNMKPGTFKLICTKEHVFWNADNTPILAQDLIAGQELYEITEYELRKLTNVRHRASFKEQNSIRMTEFNKNYDHSSLPQNKKGYKVKDPITRSLNGSIAGKKNWQDETYRKNWAEGMAKIDYSAPTSVEKEYIKLFEDNNVAARFSAGKVWIQTTTGPASPDFIIPGKNKCIEVYTKKMPKHMQDRSESSNYVTNRYNQLKTAGYDTLFLAIEDFSTALPEVQNFIHNGMKIVSVNEITHGNELRGVNKINNNILVYDLKLEEGAHVFFTNRVGSHNCGSAIASSSLITEWVKGRTIDSALTITNADIVEELCLPPVKIHCSVLAEDAVKAAIKNYQENHQ